MKSRTENSQLHHRRVPVQARSQQTVESILDATAKLLQREGLEKLNTNLIAQTAQVNISAIYKYFPNKHAIVIALAEQLNEKQTNLVLDYLKTVKTGTHWQQVLDATIDVMVEGTRDAPGLIALQSAMQANPVLKSEYRSSNEAVAIPLLERLTEGGLPVPRNKRKLLGASIGETVTAFLDLSVADGKRFDARVIAELKRVLRGYLDTYASSSETE